MINFQVSKYSLLLILLCVFWVILAGFRGLDFTPDTRNYYQEVIENFNDGRFEMFFYFLSDLYNSIFAKEIAARMLILTYALTTVCFLFLSSVNLFQEAQDRFFFVFNIFLIVGPILTFVQIRYGLMSAFFLYVLSVHLSGRRKVGFIISFLLPIFHHSGYLIFFLVNFPKKILTNYRLVLAIALLLTLVLYFSNLHYWFYEYISNAFFQAKRAYYEGRFKNSFINFHFLLYLSLLLVLVFESVKKDRIKRNIFLSMSIILFCAYVIVFPIMSEFGIRLLYLGFLTILVQVIDSNIKFNISSGFSFHLRSIVTILAVFIFINSTIRNSLFIF